MPGKNKGRRRKEERRKRKERTAESRKQAGYSNPKEPGHRNDEPKKPYLSRGRRLKFAQCGVCGEFNRKQHRTIVEHKKHEGHKRYKIIYGICKSHGEYLVEKIDLGPVRKNG